MNKNRQRAKKIAQSEFPESDAPARLLVVLAATLLNAPAGMLAIVVLSGYRLKSPEIETFFGVLSAVGFLFFALLFLVLVVTRAPTLNFAWKAVRFSMVLFFVVFAWTLLALPRLL